MWNPIPKFRQSSVVFDKPGFFAWKIKKFDEFIEFDELWWALTTIEFNTFRWNFAHVSTKGCSGFNLVLHRSCFICQSQKRRGFYTFVFCIFINNSRSK